MAETMTVEKRRSAGRQRQVEKRKADWAHHFRLLTEDEPGQALLAAFLDCFEPLAAGEQSLAGSAKRLEAAARVIPDAAARDRPDLRRALFPLLEAERANAELYRRAAEAFVLAKFKCGGALYRRLQELEATRAADLAEGEARIRQLKQDKLALMRSGPRIGGQWAQEVGHLIAEADADLGAEIYAQEPIAQLVWHARGSLKFAQQMFETHGASAENPGSWVIAAASIAGQMTEQAAPALT